MNEPLLYILLFAALIFIILLTSKLFQLKNHGLLSRNGVFKYVDRLIIITSTIGILTTILWDFNFLSYKAPIEHKDWKKITLNDFRGLNRPYHKLDGESKFASVSTSININERNDRIIIKTLFHPCRSYVFNRKLYSNGLLTHEMYHFHITEYYARLIRKEIQECINHNQYIDLTEIKNRILFLEDELQYQYDDETYHNYVLGKQIEWQNRIDSCVMSLASYSNTILSLKH